MSSTFDGIAEPSSMEARDEFSYQNGNGNSKFQHWITETVSSSYNRTAYKFSKCKKFFIWKWKILLVGLCLWLSVLVPLIILWHEVLLLRVQVSNSDAFQSITSTVETVQYEVEETDLQSTSETTTTDDYFWESSTTSRSGSTTNTPSILDKVDEKLVALRNEIQCMKGETGPVGPPGFHGIPGQPGAPGLSIKGDKGDQGMEGLPGLPGISGLPGLKGSTGSRGEKGDTGAYIMGSKGQKGETGFSGLPGYPGIKGEKGDRGRGLGFGR